MTDRLLEMMAERFPFLSAADAEQVLKLCEKNNRLFYFPEDKPNFLLGYYQFFPELINVVRNQELDVLMKCDLTHGPLVYVAVLIMPGNALKMISAIVRILEARAYAFHRYKEDGFEFHFVRNNRYGKLRTGHNYASQQ